MQVVLWIILPLAVLCAASWVGAYLMFKRRERRTRIMGRLMDLVLPGEAE